MVPFSLRLDDYAGVPVVTVTGDVARGDAGRLMDSLAALDAEPLLVVSLEACSGLHGAIVATLSGATEARAGTLIVVLPPTHPLRSVLDTASAGGASLRVADSLAAATRFSHPRASSLGRRPAARPHRSRHHSGQRP